MSEVFAPQAQFEESANDRGSRRCPLVGMFGRLIQDPLLRASSSDYSVSSVWKRDPAELEIGSNMFVCLFVCLSVLFFCQASFESARDDFKGYFKKKSLQKRGLRRKGVSAWTGLGPSPTPASSVVGTLLKLRLRRHLPRGFILVFLQLSRTYISSGL